VARPHVAVLFGGRSSEHEISCLSATSVLAAVDRDAYDVTAIGIRRDGAWTQMPVDPSRWNESTRSGGLPSVPDDAEPAFPATLLAGIDAAFPVLHGPWGEDGSIQGLLETLSIPYVGSGVLASAVAMDKGFMKSLLVAADLPVGRWTVVTAAEYARDPGEALERIHDLGLPVFVKPARAGSSVGITRVTASLEIEHALEVAFAWDPRVVVEAGIAPAREIECGVITDASGTPRASTCAEIRVRSGHDFYDFEAKYLDDSAELIVPARLPEAIESEVQALSTRAFTALGCEGLARVDFFVDDTQDPARVFVNEVNTMPGFTPISMFPRMWSVSGVSYPDLIAHLIADALRRGTGLR
jgi:D-alanine-D-alanine ligase